MVFEIDFSIQKIDLKIRKFMFVDQFCIIDFTIEMVLLQLIA